MWRFLLPVSVTLALAAPDAMARKDIFNDGKEILTPVEREATLHKESQDALKELKTAAESGNTELQEIKKLLAQMLAVQNEETALLREIVESRRQKTDGDVAHQQPGQSAPGAQDGGGSPAPAPDQAGSGDTIIRFQPSSTIPSNGAPTTENAPAKQ